MGKVKGHSCAQRCMGLKTVELTGSRGVNQEAQEQTRGLAVTFSLVLVAELVLAGCLLRDGL